MLRKFIGDRRGNLAVFTVAAMIPLLLSVGFGLDYARHSAAHKNLQEVADAAALALAATKNDSETEARKLAEDVIAANTARTRLDTVSIAALESTKDYVDLSLDGAIPATFMGLAGWETLNVAASAKAERAVTGSLEVALVLDNTWSMSDADSKGIARIDALKTAAKTLVQELLTTEDGTVRIGLVPYADYVNVGTQHRGASWLDVGADVAAVPATCENKEVEDKGKCVQTIYKTCSRTVDGIPETYACNSCGKYEFEPPRTKISKVCTGGKSAQKWFGCVGSRKTGETRLNDGSPSVRYPGYLTSSQACLNPIVDLTSSKSTLAAAIDGMIIRIGSYRPNTYIPAGLIWGMNLLSPTAPFTSGSAYDSANQKPRKVAVLMTDGENTLRFQAGDGKHVGFSSNATTAATQYATVNAETLKICANMKAENIEIFSVAFMVESETARNMLESCATDSLHYYDASDSEKLLASFSDIGKSLRIVRLAR
ncbi:MAG TPA: pilus assembly protein TadG-related protein [Rhizobiaceae bacterium]|nr:pilus assembly protein TadG-related protein [Rhizobiaceae bacterium]